MFFGWHFYQYSNDTDISETTIGRQTSVNVKNRFTEDSPYKKSDIKNVISLILFLSLY